MAHKHYKEMMMYAKDAAQIDEPWKRWECSGENISWSPIGANPSWIEDLQYRQKPKTININGYAVPEPVREPLKMGETYVFCDFRYLMASGRSSDTWENGEADEARLMAGIIHLTYDAAELHAKALLSFTENKDGT